MDISIVCILIVVFALIFDLSNGWNDASNAIATSVATRVLSPWVAVMFGAALNFAGAFYSSEVAKTIGKDIADPALVTQTTFLAAVVVAPIWITWCTLRGLPISCSHSLMGALVGSVIASAGGSALKGAGLRKIVFGIFTSPVIGFLLAGIIVLIIAWTMRRVRSSTARGVFGKLQIVSAGYMAFAHGTGDAQKAMGIITGALIAGGFYHPEGDEFIVPGWVRISCALAMGTGSAVGGWSVMRTLGSRLSHLRTYQGFAAETAAATTIVVNTLTGVPISTTHSITGAIMGVGAAQNPRAVRWAMGKKILYTWVMTFPVCIVGGYLVCKLLTAVGIE